MSSLLSIHFRPLSFISQQVINISFASLFMFSNTASADNFCDDHTQTEAQFADYAFVADWGIKVNRLYVSEQFPYAEVNQRPEIEYEYDQRIVYDENPVSILQFWQGCESFIGRQEECESDNAFSLIIMPDHLNAALESQASPINSGPEKLMKFSEPSWEVSDHPVANNMFNISMTRDEVEALGDFKQLSFRQAFRITFDANHYSPDLEFEHIQIPNRFKAKMGLFINTKVIVKSAYISGGVVEQDYTPTRIYIDDSAVCFEEYCDFENLAYDHFSKKEVHEIFSEHEKYEDPEKVYGCFNADILMGAYTVGEYGSMDAEKKVILHYEIQTSVINTKQVDNFNPMDYLDRDLTLPKEKSQGKGSLNYFLFFLLILAIRFRLIGVRNC